MQNKPYLYQIKDFRFTYPQSNSVISWDGSHNIYHGEKILITGASGSGKSTLLYGLMGFIPDIIFGKIEGDIKFKGNSVIKEPDYINGKAGLILQNPSAQMLCKSVYEELAFGLENQIIPAAIIKDTIDDWADRFNIRTLLNRNTNTLSGGEKQKIALISILMTNPDVLMLDEPTAFLDPESAHEVIQIINDSYIDKSLVFVEHNLYYLKNIITRNIHLAGDGNVQDNTTDSIKWHKPLSHLPQNKRGIELLSLKNLSFAYNDKKLLSNINLNIHAGEIITISGRNGSGKSTLLRIISGLLKQKKGTISIPGLNDNNTKALQKLTSILFQNPENHFMFNTVKKELEINPSDLFREEFSIKDEQNPFTLSEGEKRRLSMIIACQNNKRILLLDEPTFGQDHKSKVMMISLLEKMRDTGIGIIVVSHDIPFIKAIGSRHLQLKDTKLIEVQ